MSEQDPSARRRPSAKGWMPRIAVGAAVMTFVFTPAPGFATTPPPGGGGGGGGGGVVADQWYVKELQLRQVHGITQGAGVVVAVIDGGVDGTHPKLAGQLLPGHGTDEQAAPDGQRDDDPGGHGTAMSGIIAARGDVGDPTIIGIAPQAKILPISTGDEAGTPEVAQAIRWAADNGADVINLSLGSVGRALRIESSAVEYAMSKDVIVVASAGNAAPGDMYINAPANIPGVIAVTGSTQNRGFWSGSVTGPEAVVAAPSPGIRAPVPLSVSSDGLDTGAGTSNSSAVVSGLAALVRAEYPELDAANVVHRIVATSIDEGEPGRDDMFGFGVIDPLAALTADVRPVTSNQLLPGVTPEERAEALRQAEQRAGATGGVETPGGEAPDGDGQPSVPGSGEQPAAGEQPVPGDDDETTLADWLSGLGLAVAGGILLGVGAHGVATRSRRRRRAAAAAAAAYGVPPGVPYPGPPPALGVPYPGPPPALGAAGYPQPAGHADDETVRAPTPTPATATAPAPAPAPASKYHRQ